MNESPDAPPTPTAPPKPTAQPYRVQGVHVAEFAARLANRARNIVLLAAVGTLLVVLLLVSEVIHGSVTEEKFIEDNVLPIALGVAAVIIGHRNFVRGRLLQTIAEAAQRDPVAVWGVKDGWLYPLDPKASRTKLSVTLDAKEHHAIYKKPRAPITEPREPLP